MAVAEPKGQKLIKIPEKDHYFFDSKSKVIYYLKKNLNEVDKVSSGIKYDGPGSLIKATRIIPVKLKEKAQAAIKKRQVLHKLVGEFVADMLDRNSSFHLSKKFPVSNETMESYKTSVGHLQPFFEAYLVDELDDASWKKFTESFQAANPGFNMFNVTKHFRSLTKHLHESGIIKTRPRIFNPYSKKEDVKRRKKRHRSYEPGEIILMDAVCNDDQRLVLWLGYDMAFRLDDCINLTWERVHLTGEAPYIEFHGDDNKTGFAGRVPLSDTCVELLRNRKKKALGSRVFHLIADPESPILSQSIKFEDVVRNSGVTYGSHHILRHTRLTEDFGNKELPDTLVMKIRRVSLAVAMDHYIHPSKDDHEKFRNTGKAKRGIK